MSLNMGSTKSSNSSDASSLSTSSSDSYGFNTGVSGDSSISSSNSVSGGASQTTQGIAFEDLFAQMFSGASGAAGRAALNAPQLASAASQLFSGGTQFLQNLGGDAGTQYMEGRLTGANPALEDAITALKQDAGSLFTEQLNPAIVSRSVAGGTLGGSRQGVAQGVAQAATAKDFMSKAAELRYADIASKDAMAGDIAMNSLAAANTGLGSLPGLLDVFERGQNAELGTYSALSSILGGPTVLSQSESSDFSSSTAQSIAEAFSRSFGETSSTSESESTSTARSRGKSRGYNFGFGLGE